MNNFLFGLLLGVSQFAARTAWAAEAAHEGEGGSVFPGSIVQSISAILVFLILLAILHKKAWGPILKGLQDREGKIRQDLVDAEAAAARANETLKQYEAKLAEAQGDALKIVDQSRADAQRLAQQMKDDTQQQIQQMRQRATQDIMAAKEQALNQIYDEVAGVSTSVAGRILQREINPEDQQALIEESLKELASLRA
jgi:F-type H+-transporting ATPase subunit b